VLKSVGVRPYLELTEQSFMENLELIKQLHDQLNITFAVDDFGTGYSSLRTVAELAEHQVIEYLKIDGSIVSNILTSEETFQVLDSAGYMSRKLGLKNIAEFVESEELANKLQTMGIEYGQGFHFSHPLSLEELLERYGA